MGARIFDLLYYSHPRVTNAYDWVHHKLFPKFKRHGIECDCNCGNWKGL